MNMDRSEENWEYHDPTGGIGPQDPLDPIAGNPKDADRPEEVIQPAQVRRSESVAGRAASTAQPNAQPWALNRRGQPAPSATELIASILRFKWTLLLVFVLASAPIIAGIWTQVIPQYRARAEIRVRPIIPRLVFQTDENGRIPFYDSFVNTQVSLIRSLTVLQRVLDQQEVQGTRWYKNPQRSFVDRLRGNPEPPMERLRDTLSARPRRRTEIIDISFTDASARDAKVIVNAVLDQYMKYIGEKSKTAEDELYRQLLEQYRSLRTEIQGQEDTCANLHESLGTKDPSELISSKRVRLDEMQAQLSSLRNTIAILEWQMQQATADDSNDVPAAAEEMQQPRYYQDAEWRQLDRGVKTVEHQIANSIYAPNHPSMVRLKKDLEFAKELRDERETQLDELWNDQMKAPAAIPMAISDPNGPGYKEGMIPLEDQLATAKQQEELLTADLEEQQAEFKKLLKSAQLLEKETNALRHKRDLFDAVRQRLEQKNIERNVPGSIELLMRAYSPSRPDKDRRIVFTAMALVVGLGMGGGVAFLRATRNQTIYAPRDMPAPMQVPLLGHIPVTRTRRLLSDELRQNHSRVIESVRVVRTALLSRLEGQDSTAILVTSAGAGTGKSRFTKVLGKSLAQAGKKVLVVDADFQKRTLTRRFGLLDKPGLLDSLRSRSVYKRHICLTETPGLSIMPSGKRREQGAVFEEIANGAFKTCIGQLRQQYDIILLDSSPILPVADATILSNQVDGTIMVEREFVSRRAHVANALARLDSAGGRLLGTVFIGSGDGEDYGYGYYHYGKTSDVEQAV
jgi:capsular exopolysaccharide synthesis family protein